MDGRVDEVLDFWIDEVGPQGWYAVDDGLDAAIRARFGALWDEGLAGGLRQWLCAPRACLALVILLDQFPRNMFRASARAFASDHAALAAAKAAIGRGFDHRIPGDARQFFYLPLMHSEALADQERSVRLILINFGRTCSLVHARAHRDVIRRFGRFPYRNAALGRATRPQEQAFLDAGGYQAAMRAIETA